MRLIDADEFKKYISNMPLTNASKEMFKNAIKAQPTAYDIDKVVEKIEDYSFMTFGEIRTENVIEMVKTTL